MSSAALQPMSHQPTSVASLNSPPLVPASPSNRQYSPSHSSPTRDAYNANAQNSTASPAQSARRASRRPSGGNAANPSNPFPSGHNSPMSSRAAIASPGPAAVAGSSEYPASSSDRDRRKKMPPVVGPRSSSNQHTAGSAPGSRRAAAANDAAASSPRRPQHDTGRSANASVDPPAAGEPSGQSSRSRRAAQQQPSYEGGPQRTTNSTQDGGLGQSLTNVPIRTREATTASTSKTPSREASEILNSILISPPEEDIDREREREALSHPNHEDPDATIDDDDAAPPPVVSPAEHGEESRRSGRSRHDHSKREKHTKFGEYILGNTIGEGEFGKVKLGWKQEGGVQTQVAIKLIKKDALGSNPTRMAKIMREVAILKQLTHPNIVRLHKMEESERHYGIVLEYASGGELFDYILNHRFLKDNAARRLFAQLVSGVGYLHKKGIVHRDLKLENLLLDRNRNIIITDFGFANTFDPNEELSEDEELNLSDRDFVKAMGLDKVKSNGWRKGDLMQTSCGSPCYAAPELVVSDSLYTGRKVDVWSCGVILYAMLAGYLPFDDDPANPEGDNINLLYKYIVNTPLTFPEYVTPHARDLLRRILVPNPRKRADLFEVARHSWLSDFAHVVEFITSSTTTPGEIQNTTVPSEDAADGPLLNRSASVRESSKKAAAAPAIGGLVSKQGTIDPEAEAAYARQQKDSKRRTVQVEYVAPNTSTQRGEVQGQPAGKTRARSGSQGPVAVQAGPSGAGDKPLPRDPPVAQDAYGKPVVSSRRPPSAHHNMAAAARPGRDAVRTASETAYMTSAAGPPGARPATGGSMGGRASYGQPLPPEVADTNAQGRIQQPPKRGADNYGSQPQDQQNLDYGRPSVGVPQKSAKVLGFNGESETGSETKGHRRSNTIGEISGKIFGRSGSIFGGKNRKRTDQPPNQPASTEKGKRYPPISMNNSMPGGEEALGRPSMESKRSRRSFSMGLGKKRSGSLAGSQSSQEKHTRRFSLIPPSFTLKAIGIGKDSYPSPQADSHQDLPIQEPPQTDAYGRYVDQRVPPEAVDGSQIDAMYAQLQSPQQQQQFNPNQYQGRPTGVPAYLQGSMLNTGSESSIDNAQMRPPGSAPHPQQFSQPEFHDGRRVASGTGRPNRGVLQKNKRFVDAWDTDDTSRPHDHSGSSGPARRVMDFFRRRGKARGGEDR